MFEVNLFTPAQFGAFVPWLVVWRGPLSVLIHPNTVEEGLGKLEIELRNHGERAIWMGERLPLDWAGAARFASRSAYESGSGPESKSGDGDREARTTTTETGNGGNCRSERGGSGGDSNQNSSE